MADGRDEIDELMESIERPSGEGIPMTAPESKADASPSGAGAEAAPSAPPWDPKPWEFDWNGKKVSPDSLEKARTWMSQGYNYSQRMADINRQRKEVEGLSERYKGFDRYAEVDQYAKQNPEWWKFVEEQWGRRGQQQPASGGGNGGQLDPNFQAVLAPLQEEIKTLKAFYEQTQQEKAQLEQQRFDEALSTEIESIREANPNIDFDAVDQSGRTLEKRVLDHATEIGTSSFRAAFRDYLHDQLLESAKAQNLSAKAKEEQAKRERGILGTSPTPRKVSDGPVNVRGKSMDDLTRMAMEELGLHS